MQSEKETLKWGMKVALKILLGCPWKRGDKRGLGMKSGNEVDVSPSERVSK